MSYIRPLEVPNWTEQFLAFVKSCETTTNSFEGSLTKLSLD